jgi:endo-1,3(4)-beta-glucanase
MGFVTGVYTSATPLIQSGVFFKSLSPLVENGTTWKTTATLQDNTQWFIYVTPSSNSNPAPQIILNDSQNVQISSGFTGIVQIAKLAGGGPGEAAYDAAAGVYATNGTVSAALTTAATISVTGTSTASYSLSWNKAGLTSRSLLMFALPHHVSAFDGSTTSAKTNITLQTTTKGIAVGVVADSWTMFEQLQSNMTFAPWSPTTGSVTTLPAAAVSLINTVAASELSEDFVAQTNLDSMYFSGKGLAKFAAMIYATNDLANNPGLAAAGLVKLKAAMSTFVQNKQTNPLVYDTVWKGVVSSAGYTDDSADFGSKSYVYNHFSRRC